MGPHSGSTAAHAGRLVALERGAAAELWVAESLAVQGWKIAARNWRGGHGELDIVAVRGGEVQFVEVKAREFGDDSGLESVTHAKRRRLVSAAESWLASEGSASLRRFAFTVVAMTAGPDGWVAEWIDDAFDAE